MRSIDASIVARLQAGELAPYDLLIFDIDGTEFLYTDCDVPISNLGPIGSADVEFKDEDVIWFDEDVDFYTSGDRAILWDTEEKIWAPRGFSYSPLSYSMENIVDQMQLTLDNLDDAFTSSFTGGIVQGSDVILMETVLDDDDIPLGVVTKFQGTIDSWRLDNEKIEITVESVLSRWNQRTLALHSASCRVKEFKGSICAYSGGATWCDRTYARCLALNNNANFRGFRWLPSIEDKEIWWGREREI